MSYFKKKKILKGEKQRSSSDNNKRESSLHIPIDHTIDEAIDANAELSSLVNLNGELEFFIFENCTVFFNNKR